MTHLQNIGGGGAWKKLDHCNLKGNGKIWNYWIHSNNSTFDWKTKNFLLQVLGRRFIKTEKIKENLGYIFVPHFVTGRRLVLNLSQHSSDVKKTICRKNFIEILSACKCVILLFYTSYTILLEAISQKGFCSMYQFLLLAAETYLCVTGPWWVKRHVQIEGGGVGVLGE